MMRLHRHVLTVLAILLLWTAAGRAQFEPPNQAWRRHNNGIVIETNGNTPTVVYSIPVAEYKVAYVEVFAAALENDFSNGAVGKVTRLFGRAGGNVTAVGVAQSQVVVTTFANPQPQLNLVANTTTQSIDVVATGKAGLILRWWIDFVWHVTV